MRVALVFPGALGDLLLLTPAACALARGAELEASVCDALGAITPALVPCRLGPPADGALMSSLFTATPARSLLEWLRSVDVVHAWIGRAPDRDEVVRRLAAATGVGSVRCHAVERGDGTLHASLAYAAMLGLSGPLPAPVLALDDRRPAPSTWTGPPSSRLVIHPGAGSRAKRWSIDGFRAIADDWRNAGGDVTILLGPAEQDEEARWCATGHRVASRLAVIDAAALLASAPRYLGNDSGVSHVAGALGRVGVVLFGPTRAERWRPLGGRLVTRRFDVDAEARVAREVQRLLGDPAALVPRGLA